MHAAAASAGNVELRTQRRATVAGSAQQPFRCQAQSQRRRANERAGGCCAGGTYRKRGRGVQGERARPCKERKGRTMMRDWLRTFLFTAVWLWTQRQFPSINDCCKKVFASVSIFCSGCSGCSCRRSCRRQGVVLSSRPSGGEKKKERKKGGGGSGGGGRARSFGQAWE